MPAGVHFVVFCSGFFAVFHDPSMIVMNERYANVSLYGLIHVIMHHHFKISSKLAGARCACAA